MDTDRINKPESIIYTIGYQAYTPEKLAVQLRSLGVERLVDVRTSPWSRKPGFGRKELEVGFGMSPGPIYEWRGDMLGGKGDAISTEAIDWLASQRGILTLLCMEDDPCGCHRYWLIARRLLKLGIECVHIHGEKEYSTSGLRGRCGEVPPRQRQQYLGF